MRREPAVARAVGRAANQRKVCASPSRERDRGLQPSSALGLARRRRTTPAARPGASARTRSAPSCPPPRCRMFARSTHRRPDARADVEPRASSRPTGGSVFVAACHSRLAPRRRRTRSRASACRRRRSSARVPARMRPQKIATTPASPCGSCRGPYTLPKRSATRVEPVHAAVVREVVLDRELRDRVRRLGILLEVLEVRRRREVAVERAARRREDDARLRRLLCAPPRAG